MSCRGENIDSKCIHIDTEWVRKSGWLSQSCWTGKTRRIKFWFDDVFTTRGGFMSLQFFFMKIHILWKVLNLYPQDCLSWELSLNLNHRTPLGESITTNKKWWVGEKLSVSKEDILIVIHLLLLSRKHQVLYTYISPKALHDFTFYYTSL